VVGICSAAPATAPLGLLASHAAELARRGIVGSESVAEFASVLAGQVDLVIGAVDAERDRLVGSAAIKVINEKD
jgi:hypothetical protein